MPEPQGEPAAGALRLFGEREGLVPGAQPKVVVACPEPRVRVTGGVVAVPWRVADCRVVGPAL